MVTFSLSELAGMMADLVDDDGEDVDITFLHWSDAQPHRIDIVDGKPIAVPVATGTA